MLTRNSHVQPDKFGLNFPSLLGTLCLAAILQLPAQDLNFTAVRAEVDFATKLQSWDGFGFNYVETAQTRDYAADPQDYGGFSLLTETDRQKIVDLVFGDDGLRVGLLKMFLDPWHQKEPGRRTRFDNYYNALRAAGLYDKAKGNSRARP